MKAVDEVMSEVRCFDEGICLDLYTQRAMSMPLSSFPNITKLPVVGAKHSYDVHDTNDHSSTVPSTTFPTA